LILKLLIIGLNVTLKSGRKWRLGNPGADLLAAGGQRVDVFAVKALELLGDAPFEPIGGEEFAEGLGRGGEAAGHADAGGGQGGGHLAERSVLAADLREVGQPQIL